MKPHAEWVPSPNFKASTNARVVSCLVIHSTATARIDSPMGWLCNPDAKASAHYLIDRDGTVYQLVAESNIAYHAGKSIWKGQKFVNNFSIGIELVNDNTGGMLYPEPQLRSAAALSAAICLERNIKLADVVGHVDVVDGDSPEELTKRLQLHSDPKGFPWPYFRQLLTDLGVS